MTSGYQATLHRIYGSTIPDRGSAAPMFGSNIDFQRFLLSNKVSRRACVYINAALMRLLVPRVLLRHLGCYVRLPTSIPSLMCASICP
jgi:hypothetical protein